MLKPGIDMLKIREAMKAEGALGVMPTWGGKPVYDNALWSVPKKLYRIESNAVAEKLIRKQQMGVNLNWLMAPRRDINRLVEAFDKVLFGMLKDLRKSISQEENLPPFVIFQDPSLEDMCNQYPTTIDELMHITGVGPGKAQKYGQEFVDLIRIYVEDNEIVRPQDFVVKSPINKSATKVFIIESIDRKLSFEDIARAKGMEMDELLTEIEKIVASGMRLNINYYIDEVIDPEHQEDILDYFNEAESDSVQAAVEALGEDEYPIEEIRIMRIKLMSDLGN